MSLNPTGNDRSGEKPPPASENATRYISAEDVDRPDDWDLEVDVHPTSGGQDTGLVGVLGEYLLLEPIGSGGMGKVFRAEHRTMNREVALKILSKEIAERPSVLQQFFSEIRAVAKLMHPNIVTAFDAGSAGEMHYLVMELVKGQTLAEWVKQRGPLAEDEAISVLKQAADALSYAHELGIVHRDIKPGNLMITDKGVVKILDFGLARLATNQGLEGNKRVFMGTPEYMSPEQIQNADRVDGRSDLYGLGATLFYLLTGDTMFSGEKMQVARAQLREQPPALFEVRHGLDLRLDSIFTKLVSKDPEDRYRTADELLQHLERLGLGGKLARGDLFKKGGYRLSTDSPTRSGFSTSTLAKKSQIVAIELGLLSSGAAYCDPDTGPQLIAQDEGNPRYLRNMLWSQGKNIRIGAEAAALRQVDPGKIFHSVQRWIGQSSVQRPFGGELVPPEVIMGAILRQIMLNAAAATDATSSAIVTVPSCYGQLHRRAIRDACRIAGVELVQLLDKPLAAALSWLDLQYRLADPARSAADQKLLVVQLAGTGLDVSVIHAYGTTARQLGSCGHWKLGQTRWQHLLVQYFSHQLKEQTGRVIRDDVAAATRLQRTIEIAFGQLTRSRKVEVRFEWAGASIRQTVTQEGLLKIAPNLKQSIEQSIATACAISKVEPSEIDQVLLSGSMLMMNPLQEIVSDVIPHAVDLSFIEKTDLAFGAAIQAKHLGTLGDKNQYVSPEAVASTTYDIALLSESSTRAESGSETLQRPKVLIEKGTQIPCTSTRTIRPQTDLVCGKTLSPVQLIESSSLGHGNWLKLGSLDLAKAVNGFNPEEPLQLRMQVDSSGILQSTLVRPSDDQRIPVPVSSEPGLSNADIVGWRDWLDTTSLCSQ